MGLCGAGSSIVLGEAAADSRTAFAVGSDMGVDLGTGSGDDFTCATIGGPGGCAGMGMGEGAALAILASWVGVSLVGLSVMI